MKFREALGLAYMCSVFSWSIEHANFWAKLSSVPSWAEGIHLVVSGLMLLSLTVLIPGYVIGWAGGDD